MSVTGDTAKYTQIIHPAGVVHFHLSPILPREKNETRPFRKRNQPYQLDPTQNPPNVNATSWSPLTYVIKTEPILSKAALEAH